MQSGILSILTGLTTGYFKKQAVVYKELHKIRIT